MKMRENQRREVIDEAKKVSKRALDSQFAFLKRVGESSLPPTALDKRVVFSIDKYILDNSDTDIYNLSDYLTIPTITETNKFTFGDEVFFYGNIQTDIKATIYKTQITCNVLPNQFTSSENPTFNPDQDKVAFTQVGIFDADKTLVAIGKFSEPITRKYNSDMVVIQATIDF